MGRSDAFARLATLRDQAVKVRGEIGPSVEPSDVRHVLLVLSASRGGSSLLYELLSADECVASLAGEHVPFYRLHGVDATEASDRSDVWDVDRLQSPDVAEDIARTLLTEVRIGRGTCAPDAPEAIALLAFRLAVQWPELDFSFDELCKRIGDAARSRPPTPRPGGPGHVLLRTVKELRRLGLAVDPGLYDCPTAEEGAEPIVPMRAGPLRAEYCVEEPPFICPEPGRLPEPGELTTVPLVLKAPLDAYRLPLLQAMFPAAEFTVVHLTRNPAASINGLRDGWLSRGFFSHDTTALGHRLEISGYTRTDAPWTQRWWNFDLPPGWQEYRDRPLPEVCAFQWKSVHDAVLGALSPGTPVPLRLRCHVRVHFEELIAGPGPRAAALRRIRGAAGLPPSLGSGTSASPMSDALPVVMATSPPSPGRWRRNAAQILPLIARSDVAETAAALGYDPTHVLDDAQEFAWQWA